MNTVTLSVASRLRAMTAQGEMPIREVARRAGRDVKAVHGDRRR